MSRIEEELKATGLAQVIVVLETPAAPQRAGAAVRGAARAAMPTRSALLASSKALTRYFTTGPTSHDAALARGMKAAARRRATRSGAAPKRAVAAAVPKVRTYPNLGLMLGTINKEGLKGLKQDERVRAVTHAPQLSLIRPVESAAAAAVGDVTWGLKHLEIPELWDKGFTGKGVLVGHLDTGVDGTHPALKGAIAHFAEFDPIGEPVPGAQPHDTDEHGTHTAGTIAGRKVGATAFGVAPDATLASAIVIEGGNVIARILAGMDWAVGLGVRILSMSLGLRGFVEDFLPVTRILRARGVLPVFAVGNEGPGTSRSPGNYAEALSVGAHNADDEVADFSSSQTFVRPVDPTVPDLVAPGVDTISSVPGGGFAKMSGSSMATPHIAGLAALLFEAMPAATIDQVESAIFASCVLPSSMTADRANRGVPNGPRALAALQGGSRPGRGRGGDPGRGQTQTPEKGGERRFRQGGGQSDDPGGSQTQSTEKEGEQAPRGGEVGEDFASLNRVRYRE